MLGLRITITFTTIYSLQSAKVGIISELAKCEGESGGKYEVVGAVGGASRTGDGGSWEDKKLCQRYEPYRLVTLAKYIGCSFLTNCCAELLFKSIL